MQAPVTLADVVERLPSHGNRTALVAGDASVTFAQLVADANRLANGLLGLGVAPGERFAFSFPNGIETVLCYLACAQAGIVAVPLAQRLTPAEVAAQLADSGAVGIAYDESRAEVVETGAAHVDHVAFALSGGGSSGLAFRDVIERSRDIAPSRRPDPEEPCCVMYTGGTTGDSKAAIQTQRSWAASVETVVEQWRLQRADRHLVVLPMSHVAWFSTAAQLHAGATAILLDRWDPELVLDLVEREHITTLNMIPTMLGDLVEAVPGGRPRNLSSLRQLTVAGSPMPEELFHRAHAAFGPVIGNIYGMTETSGPVSYLLPHDMQAERVRSGGRAGRYVELVILDDEGHVLAGTGSGEIGLAGPQVTTGYLNRPEETAAAFRNGYFLTGDVGFVDEEGFVFIVDRRKDMIKSGGLNVYPKEIEETLYTHPDVVEAAVVGLPDPRWIEAVHGFVVVRRGAAVSADELRAHCRERLSAYKVPKAIHFEEKLPRTPVGKFDKRALRARHLGEPTSIA
jgi:acyl-CoA synthetase (AMP-forming)/AMP-acid ligase II